MWESLWQTSDKLKDAGYILPPVAHLGSGPSGVQYYPGTGLPEKYDKHFFMVDFRGGSSAAPCIPSRSSQTGATYKLVDQANFIKGMLCHRHRLQHRAAECMPATGPKGGTNPEKGRIYRIFDPNPPKDAARRPDAQTAGGWIRQNIRMTNW